MKNVQKYKKYLLYTKKGVHYKFVITEERMEEQ